MRHTTPNEVTQERVKYVHVVARREPKTDLHVVRASSGLRTLFEERHYKNTESMIDWTTYHVVPCYRSDGLQRTAPCGQQRVEAAETPTNNPKLIMFSCVDIRRASAAGVVLLLVVASAARAASIDASNLVYETPRIASGDQLVSHVINDCFGADTMVCLKGKVLNYLDTQLNINEEYGRSFESNKIDELIYDRAARVMTQSQFRVQLPAAVFDRAELSYAPDTGLDITPAAEEGEFAQ